jgi:hypothetical protein
MEEMEKEFLDRLPKSLKKFYEILEELEVQDK